MKDHLHKYSFFLIKKIKHGTKQGGGNRGPIGQLLLVNSKKKITIRFYKISSILSSFKILKKIIIKGHEIERLCH